jgi:hypothetical protein
MVGPRTHRLSPGHGHIELVSVDERGIGRLRKKTTGPGGQRPRQVSPRSLCLRPCAYLRGGRSSGGCHARGRYPCESFRRALTRRSCFPQPRTRVVRASSSASFSTSQAARRNACSEPKPRSLTAVRFSSRFRGRVSKVARNGFLPTCV